MFERIRMHTNAFLKFFSVSIDLHELAWHSSGPIKCETLECHSNGKHITIERLNVASRFQSIARIAMQCHPSL